MRQKAGHDTQTVSNVCQTNFLTKSIQPTGLARTPPHGTPFQEEFVVMRKIYTQN